MKLHLIALVSLVGLISACTTERVVVREKAAPQTVVVDDDTPTDVTVYDPPPEVIRERVTVAPSRAHFWIAGHWGYRGGRYAWVPGRWVLSPHPYAVWIGGHWAPYGRGWRWIPGHWR